MINSFIEQVGKDNFLNIVFFSVTALAAVVDLVILSRVQKKMTVRSALIQSIIWITLALLFGGLIYYIENQERFVEYLTAYLMEYSLSMDNIFVFIIIFSFFRLSEKNIPKVLFYGILIAIGLRILFIIAGVALVEKFEWIIYVFGAVLIYTGIKLLFQNENQENDPSRNFLYRFFSKRLNLVDEQESGKLMIKREGKIFFTTLFLVVVVIGSTDLLFAIDSIPAAFGITSHKMVIMSSNIFAVMGLRAMFFMLRGAVDRFHYLQEGISIVLIFIGVKMSLGIFDFHISNLVSLTVILAVLGSSILISLLNPKKEV